MDKIKENAKSDYITMIEKSWTYDRLTESEKKHVRLAINESCISGTYNQRWTQLHNIYTAFLYALDYTEYCALWREPDTANKPLF